MRDCITSIVFRILLFGPVVVFFGYIIIVDIKKALAGEKKEPDSSPPEEVYDESECEAFYLVKNAYDSLTSQHARGYGPWLSSIIDRSIRYEIVRDERGRVHIAYEGTCPPNVALAAMLKTRDELISSRFDLSEINRAIERLMSM